MSEIQTNIESLTPNDPEKDLFVVKFVGQLDETTVESEANKVYALFEEAEDKAVTLIFDLRELGYLNSRSVGYLTDWQTRAQKTGGAVMIVSPRENVLDIIQVVGLTQFIKVYPNLEEAKLAALEV